MSKCSKFRNIGIIAHIDAGKTTVTERILYYCGKEYKLGEVDDGAAAMDWLPEERKRGITITSAATTIYWRDHRINLIDTPGHVDFTSEVEKSLRVLDGAVGVFDGVAGVEAQSETVWRQADSYRIPRLAFINKLDKTGADFDGAVETLVEKLGVKPVVLYLPVGAERDFTGVVDVLGEEALYFDEKDYGRTVIREKVPEKLRERVALGKEAVQETACEYSEELLTRYLDGEKLSKADFLKGLRSGVLKGEIVPVFCGAALRNKGVQPLLDGVCALLPSPLDRGEIRGKSPDGRREDVRRTEESERFCGLGFKLYFEPHGELMFTRVYSGRLDRGQRVAVVRNGSKVRRGRVGKIFLMHADERQELESAVAGEIVALRGIKGIATGDTIADPKHPILLHGIGFPETVVSQAIEPRSASERDRMLEALGVISREDPTFTWKDDEDTGQLIINGMGELHLELIVSRLLDEWKIRAKAGKPRVWYRQTIQDEGYGEAEFDRELGGRTHFARVKVRVVPDSTAAKPTTKVKLDPKYVPRDFWAAIEEGLRAGLETGGPLGFPWINMHAETIGGEARVGDSSQVAFTAAAQEAFNDAVEQAGHVILEPIMRFDIFVPQEHYGNVTADLTRRRAEITHTAVQAKGQRLEGKIPLAESFGYINTLRSLTQGRGGMTLEPSGFTPAPQEVAERFEI